MYVPTVLPAVFIVIVTVHHRLPLLAYRRCATHLW